MLNNLELPRAKEGELALRQFGDEYLLKYMLEFETAGSPSLLNIERLTHPFAYRLKVQEADEIVERTVDLIETFNYLLGLHVKKLREFQADTVAAGILPAGAPGFQPGDQTAKASRSGGKMPPATAARMAAATRLYRAVLGEDRRGKSVVVVWRDSAGLENNPLALQADRQFIEQTILPTLLGKDARPDRLLVNQPCTAVEAEAIEPEFKRLMFGPLG